MIVWLQGIAAVCVLALAAQVSPAFAQVVPNIQFTKTGPATVLPAAQFTYTLTATNVGIGNSDPLLISDPLPPGVLYVSHATQTSSFISCNFAGGTLSCSGNGLLPTEFHRIIITVKLSDEVQAGASFTNVATIDHDRGRGAPQDAIAPPQRIPDPSLPKTAQVSTQVVAPASADVSVTKTAPPTVIQGGTLVYTLTVSNAGPRIAEDVSLADALPPGVTFTSLITPAGWTCTTPAPGATGTISCLAGPLASGSTSGPFTLTVRVGDTTTGTLTNAVLLNSPVPDPNLANNSAVASTDVLVAPPPTSLSLALSFSPPTYYVAGQVIEVRYLVTNTSAVTVTGIVVTDPKVPNITCPQTTLTTGASMTCTGPYTITAADMAAGTSAFTAAVTGSGGAAATATGAISAIVVIVIQNDDFVRTRGQLLVVDPPGLHDRAGQVTAGLTESNGGPTLNFAASFLGGASTAANDLASGAVVLPFKIWIDGKLTLHTRDNGGGGFGQLGLGSDYLVNENLLVGAALYIDWMTDKKTDRTTTGVGYLAGSYVSAEIAEHLTFDGGIFFGGSTNNVAVTVGNTIFSGTFNTQRVVVQAQLDGLWNLDVLTIRPDATMFLRHETVGNYTVRDAQGTVVAVSGFTNTSLNLSGGALFEKAIPLESGLVFIPQAGFRLGITGRGDALALDNPYGSVSVGFVLEGDAWKYQSTVEMSLWASSLKAATWKGTLAGQF